LVPATGDQRHEDNDTLCPRELAAAGDVLGAFRGDRLNAVEEKYAQAGLDHRVGHFRPLRIIS
jgi:hypothetical protein